MLSSFSPQPPYIPNTGKAKVFVLACIDPRFTSYLSWFLNYQKQLGHNYDLFVLAGASIGVNQAISGSPHFPLANPLSTPPVFPTWSTTFIDNLRVGIALHNITNIWVFDHSRCGAYQAFLNLGTEYETDQNHIDQIATLYAYLQTNPAGSPNLPTDVADIDLSNLNYRGFLMDIDGRIRMVETDTNDENHLEDVELNFSVDQVNQLWKYATIALGIFVFIQAIRK